MPLCLPFPLTRVLAKTAVYALVLWGITSLGRAQPIAPQLNSITLTSPSPLTAGSNLTYSYSITVGANPVQKIGVEFRDAEGLSYSAGDTGNAVGTITLPTSATTWPNSSYTVSSIFIADTAGVQAYYQPNGASFSVSYSSDATGPATSSINPATLGFTISGGLSAMIAPSLTSISFAPTTIALGGTVTVSYTIAPGTLPPVYMSVTLYTTGAGVLPSLDGFISAPSGTFTTTLSPYMWPGIYSIRSVLVVDSRAGASNYSSDGTISYDWGESGATPYPGLFSAVTLTVSSDPAPSPTPTPTPTNLPSSPTPTPTPLPAILISTQPISSNASVGQAALFTVSASGYGSLSYQWFFNGIAVTGATSSTYSIPSTKTSDSGSYTVTITGLSGSVISNGAILAVAPTSGGPTLSTQPASSTIAPGASVAFNAVSGTAGATYQWYLNGVLIPLQSASAAGFAAALSERVADTVSGQTSTILFLSGTTAADSGIYQCVVTTPAGSVLSNPATLRIISSNDPGRLINLSCRAPVGTGAGVLIAGFVVGGLGTSGAEPVLVRASGPALTSFSVSGTLPDPVLKLFDSSAQLVISNSGWSGNPLISAESDSVGAFAWTDPSSHDSAVEMAIASGSYTAQISGASNDTGVALAEVYDATPTGSYTLVSPRLINVSARVSVGTGANILIAGFVVGGTTAKTVLIRVSGPALAQFAVSGTLADPQLQVLNSSNQVVAANSGWAANTQISSAAQAVGAFSWGTSTTADAALLITLAPGSYTAQVSGASGDTGVALVEVYDVQ